MSDLTFFWHDYETFGRVPRRDRPAQFAGLRTDAELNEIGEPLMLYCQPAPDYLPDPESCLLTGILPQHCLQRGVPEHEFAAAIETVLALPGTVGVGYNSIRFDDEVTRFLLWRNLAVAAVLGPIGVAIGALVRNQIVTVVGLVALAAVIEPAVSQVAPVVGRFGPLSGAPGGVLGGSEASTLLAPGLALAILVAWALAAFAAAAWRLNRRDLV